MNMQEDYVSFETAKLLRDKGFEEVCVAYYEDYGTRQHLYISDKRGAFNIGFKQCDDLSNRFSLPKDRYKCAAPTLQMAMKWLREMHLILYIIYPNLETGKLRFSWRIYKLEQDKKHYVEELPGIGEYYKDSDELFTTYKEAEESLIKYSLENLV